MKPSRWPIYMLSIKLEMSILNLLSNFKTKRDTKRQKFSSSKQAKLKKLSACMKT